MLTLTIEARTSGSPSTSRKEGKLPAVIYGRHEASTPISVDMRSFLKVFREAGESAVITLEGVGGAKQALIHDVAVDPVSGTPIHADFYVIEKGQKVTVSVPLSFVGTSAAVKDHGGILVKVMHELEMEVDPTELPHELEVDISALSTLESQITVRDIKAPASAKVTLDPEEVVALVSVAKEETEEAAPVDLSAIETSVERGKKEEEGEAEAA